MGDGFLLYRGVHDYPLELGWLDDPERCRRINAGLEQIFHPGLADSTAKATDLRGIAGQARLVKGHAAEVLSDHVTATRLPASSRTTRNPLN
jgi:hypothetical protein